MEKKKKRTIAFFMIEGALFMIIPFLIMDTPQYIKAAYFGFMAFALCASFFFWSVSFEPNPKKTLICLFCTALCSVSLFAGLSFYLYQEEIYLSSTVEVYQIDYFDENQNLVYSKQFEECIYHGNDQVEYYDDAGNYIIITSKRIKK